MTKDLENSIVLIKSIVKESCIKGQNHIDFTLADSEKRHIYESAMIVIRNAISNGEISESDLKEKLNIN